MKQGCAYLYGRRIFLFVTARARECKKRACRYQKIRQKMTFHVVYLKGQLFAHVIFLLYLCTRKGFSVLSQSIEELHFAQLNCPIFFEHTP